MGYLAFGEQAKEDMKKEQGKEKASYIRLKDGESLKVKLISDHDFARYRAHNSFPLEIFTQSCLGEETCLFCEAAKKMQPLVPYQQQDHEYYPFLSLRATYRVLFAFWDLEQEKIRFFDASDFQAKSLVSSIEEYTESLQDYAFTLKRIGQKQASYSITPIIKTTTIDQGHMLAAPEQIEQALFEGILAPKATREQQQKELERIHYPLELIQKEDLPF